MGEKDFQQFLLIKKILGKKYKINMESSWMIGDKTVDIIAANNAGIYNTIQVRSGHKFNESLSKANFIIDSIIDSKEIIS